MLYNHGIWEDDYYRPPEDCRLYDIQVKSSWGFLRRYHGRQAQTGALPTQCNFVCKKLRG